MKTTKKIMSIILLMMTLLNTVFAQADGPMTSSSPVQQGGGSFGVSSFDGPMVSPMMGEYRFSDAPIVPIEIVLKGRQEVTHFLIALVDHASIEYNGRSIVSPRSIFLSREDLAKRGYFHHNSFTELQEAMAQTQFSAEVVPTPEGYYDVRADIFLFSKEGKIVLQGGGYLNITKDRAGLSAQDFQPWLSIPNEILLKGDGYINGAKWMAEGHRDEDIQRNIADDGSTTFLVLPTRLLGNGQLFISTASGVKGVDLKTGASINGQKVVALLGKSQSSDVLSLRNPTTLNLDWEKLNIRFFKSEGKVYGRFPLIDLVTDKGISESILPMVAVWGTDYKYVPKRIILKPLFTNDGKNLEERELPITKGGGWDLRIPPGGYHILVEFEVLDWEQDPNPRG